MRKKVLTSKMKTTQSGWTLLIILVVIAIIGVIVVKNYGWSPNADGKSRLSLEGRITEAEEAQAFHTELATGRANKDVDEEENEEDY